MLSKERGEKEDKKKMSDTSEDEDESTATETNSDMSWQCETNVRTRTRRNVKLREEFSEEDAEYYDQDHFKSCESDGTWKAGSEELKDVLNEELHSGWDSNDDDDDDDDEDSDEQKPKRRSTIARSSTMDPIIRGMLSDVTTHTVKLPLPITFVELPEPAAPWRPPSRIPPVIAKSSVKGLPEGKRIQFINGRSVSWMHQVETVLSNCKEGDEVKLSVVNDDDSSSEHEEDEEDEEDEESESETVSSKATVQEKSILKPAAKRSGKGRCITAKQAKDWQKQRLATAARLAKDTSDSLALIVEKMKRAEDLRAEQREALKKRRRLEGPKVVIKGLKNGKSLYSFVEKYPAPYEVDYTRDHFKGVEESGHLFIKMWKYKDPITQLGYDVPGAFKLIRKGSHLANDYLTQTALETPPTRLGDTPTSAPQLDPSVREMIEADNVRLETWQELLTKFTEVAVQRLAEEMVEKKTRKR
eukprot:TRINITY_DN3258_c0_g1_i1.p2 TRINITY_DN3258_c0_g1~~TRINITY_DN3258_c0_g1_i1.p2  ORF type:complete len:472 (+),score=125.61 TRINITY_DN3258_c0_g1_i1:1794-3209(+)